MQRGFVVFVMKFLKLPVLEEEPSSYSEFFCA